MANCRRWVKLGHEVHVITCAPNVPNGVVYEGYRNRFCQTEVIDGIRVTRVWTYLAANKGTAKRILNYLSFMVSATLAGLSAQRPDLVLATSPQFFNGWAGVILSRLRRLPLVLEIRDLWPDSIVVLGAMQNRHLLRVLYWLEKRMYAASDRIVTVGEGYRQDLLDKGVSDSIISVIPNGVDKELFFPIPADPEARGRYCPNGGFTCAYVGTIGMACGLEVILEAAHILRKEGINGIRFLLVGDGAQREELEQRARLDGLDNVVFTGRIDKHLVPRVLSVVDACLVHLRKTDLFKRVLPSKIFEIAAMEKPIILGVEGCAAEIVKAAEAGICIEPEDAQGLVNAVNRLANDRPLGESLGKSGRRYVMRYYDRDSLAERYVSLLQQTGRRRVRRSCGRENVL